jgi:hypothetical protein
LRVSVRVACWLAATKQRHGAGIGFSTYENGF